MDAGEPAAGCRCTEYVRVLVMQKKCLGCGRVLIGRNKMFCSQECRMKYLRNMKRCVICGKEFHAPPSSLKETCSAECESENRRRNGKENPVYAITLAMAHEAAKTNPNTAPVETNRGAKSWVIVSPEGKKYEINNLALWARDHEEILPGSARQFADGIRKIKQSIQGKRKRPAYQYKGWTLESWSEENFARNDFPVNEKKPPRVRMSDSERRRRKRERERKRYQEKKKQKGSS